MNHHVVAKDVGDREFGVGAGQEEKQAEGEAEAEAALLAEDIYSVLVMGEDYLETGRVVVKL